MRKSNLLFSMSLLTALIFSVAVFTNCKGPKGDEGPAGTDGVDANETCKLCHNPDVVSKIAAEFDFSKHHYGEAAFEEAGRTACAPCHESEAFKYVIANNTPVTFADTGVIDNKYINQYYVPANSAYGEFTCYTCHDKLHTTYGSSDLPSIRTTAAVPMTMWGGTKTINLTQDGGVSNLCVRCHQPRPITTTSTSTFGGNVLDYANLITNPTDTFYKNYATSSNIVSLSFRTGPHYGTVSAIYAGIGGIEFGTGYGNSPHTTLASCKDCHMAEITGAAGGHTFNTMGNFKGCNVSGCHSASPITSTSTKWTATRSEIKGLIDQLATKINTLGDGTNPVMQIDLDTETNLWYNMSTAHYDGYLNLYNSSSNPTGYYGATGNPKFPNLTNAQFGTIFNFQLALREYSLGIHNTEYVRTLLTNSLAAW